MPTCCETLLILIYLFSDMIRFASSILLFERYTDKFNPVFFLNHVDR